VNDHSFLRPTSCRPRKASQKQPISIWRDFSLIGFNNYQSCTIEPRFFTEMVLIIFLIPNIVHLYIDFNRISFFWIIAHNYCRKCSIIDNILNIDTFLNHMHIINSSFCPNLNNLSMTVISKLVILLFSLNLFKIVFVILRKLYL